MAALRSNGRPEPEVIVNFLDGHSYAKNKLEEVFRILRLDKPYPKPPKAPASSSRSEDVDLIVQEFEVTRSQAEKILGDAGGSIAEALRRMVEL
ncbi:hypothetical protein BV20DRAFT_1050464 [Pilatotrama ljubarskyi]|nr:hypothetical protein BV20DRAFT_1050464 [Pilatotrama ljubarskyi]